MSEDDFSDNAEIELWGVSLDTASCIFLLGHEESASGHGLSKSARRSSVYMCEKEQRQDENISHFKAFGFACFCFTAAV